MGLRYIGGGAFLFGVPARDLADDEVKEHGGESALLALRCNDAPLYERELSARRTKAADVPQEEGE